MVSDTAAESRLAFIEIPPVAFPGVEEMKIGFVGAVSTLSIL